MSVLAGWPARRAIDDSIFFTSEGGAVRWGGDTIDAALCIAPVWSAVALIADSFVVAPWSLHKGDLGSSVQKPLPAWLARPSTSVSVIDWRFQLVASLKLRGNAYGYLTGSGTRPTGVVWLHPDTVTVLEKRDALPEYWVEGRQEFLHAHGGRIVHIRDFVVPGTVKGLSPVAVFQQQFETAAWAAQYGHEFFKNATRPSGILRYKKGGLKPGASVEAKRLFKEATRGGDIATLDGDWEWQSLTIAPEEAQFLATIKATANTVASIYRVPPEDIGGESGSSRSYSNREMDQGVLNTRTLLPLGERVKAAFDPMLAADEFLAIDLDVLSRPTGLEQARTDTERLKNGTKQLAELRRRDNAPMLTDAEIEQWQQWYATTKSESESDATSTSLSMTKEAP